MTPEEEEDSVVIVSVADVCMGNNLPPPFITSKVPSVAAPVPLGIFFLHLKEKKPTDAFKRV